MADEIAIRVDGVSKNFVLPHERSGSLKNAFTSLVTAGKHGGSNETQHALKDISFEIKKGEFFGIVGRNGSGKSTLLKILAGIYQPTSGSIETNGQLVPFIELGVGFNAELTGRENVYLNGAMLGFSRKAIEAMYDDIVAFAELEKFMDQKLKNYSSGMQVRLAFSMAIRADADILLVDEVLAVGDADFQRKCFDYFRKLKRDKKTVVFVSHDMSAVREYCERAVLIEKSKMVIKGSSAQVATEYTKMFTPKSGNATEDNKGRWGDQSMIQKSVTIKPKVCDSSVKDIQIAVTVQANEAIDDPVFGLLVKNAVGSHLLGNNSKLKLVKTGSFKQGQKATVTWTVPNIFNDGQYFIDIAISHNDAITQYDWWEDAGNFTVYKEDRTPYPINPDLKIAIEKKG